jgi:Uma2 family endonuclease
MTPVLSISVEEYLGTSFEDGDREYIDGELQEKARGEIDHSDIQTLIAVWFYNHCKHLGLRPLVEVRTRVSATRYRVPDVAVVKGPKPTGRVIAEPPFLAIEIISPEDRLSRMEERIDDYIRFGIRFIWVVDPGTGRGYVYTGQRRIPVEGGIFWTEDPRVELDFAKLSEEPVWQSPDRATIPSRSQTAKIFIVA